MWLLLGVFVTPSCENVYVALLDYSAKSFGEITIAMATTFYVVFTYRLLANSEVQRRISTEPHLTVRWYQDSKHTDTQLAKMRLFADKARSWLIDTVAFEPNTIDESGMATGDRYLILELSNVRNIPIGWVTLAVDGTMEIPDNPIMRFRDELRIRDLQIDNIVKLKVTMLDLFPIPQPAKVTLVVKVMTYGAIDGGDVLDDFSGDSQTSATGEFIPTALKDPQPN